MKQKEIFFIINETFNNFDLIVHYTQYLACSLIRKIFCNVKKDYVKRKKVDDVGEIIFRIQSSQIFASRMKTLVK